MKTLEGIDALRAWRSSQNATSSVALVPTMGALHEGHLTLVRRARAECDVVAVSVFVNPTQFAPGEDLESYPRDRERDAELTAAAGADLTWFADPEEIYPPGFTTVVDLPRLARRLCGIDRPHHFPGVALVVLKLFHLFQPTHAVFGEKDYQQSVLVRRMVRDLDLEIEIITGPTIREESGLARSSRNESLSPAGRTAAAALSRGLFRARDAFQGGERDAAALIGVAVAEFGNPKIALDYVELVDPDSLEPIETVGERGARLLVAAKVESARLIDNVALGGAES